MKVNYKIHRRLLYVAEKASYVGKQCVFIFLCISLTVECRVKVTSTVNYLFVCLPAYLSIHFSAEVLIYNNSMTLHPSVK